MQANLCINSAWQHSKYSAMQSLQSLHSDGVLEKVILIQKLHTTEEILRQKQAVYEISFSLGNRNTHAFCRVCWGLFGHSIAELKVGLYCWTNVLGLLCSWQWNIHFIAVKLLCSKAGWPHPNCLLGAVAGLCQLTGWTWKLFHIKMVIFDQNLCQGLWRQAPTVGGWVSGIFSKQRS